MAPVTDLTFDQVNAEFEEGFAPFFVGEDSDGNTALLLNVSLVNGMPLDTGSTGNTGVVKLLVKLREYCCKAQSTANRDQLNDGLLDAFPPSTLENSFIDGTILQSGTIRSRITTASATQIEGATKKPSF